ncbi:MAG: hypothetical protein J6W13_11380 [Salinivirgaceae bacterium]|nr:hypothetical protein [Salinivirgaceae bacterium]
MSDFSRGFWKRAGQNTADRLSNAVFGDKWARPYKRVTDEARADAIRTRAEAAERRAEAKAYEMEKRAEIAERNQLNAIDAAVLQNVDKVIAMPFAENVSELVNQLSGLVTQLSINSFSKSTAEEKIRAKYTETVYQKLEQGINILLIKDPYNPNMQYIYDAYLKAKKERGKTTRRKALLITWGIIGWAFMFGLGLASEGTPQLLVITIFVSFITAFICLRISRKRKKKDKRRLADARKAFDARQSQIQQLQQEQEQIMTQPVAEQPVVEQRQTFSQKQLLDHLWNKYSHLSPLMQNGYRACQISEQKDILIIGLYCNTDQIVKGKTIYPLSQHERISSLDYNLNGAGINLQSRAAYMDLLPIQSSNAPIEILNEIILNPKMFDYVIEQMSLNQTIMEDVVRPELIIVKSDESWAFFGKNPEYVWMGYAFKTIAKTSYGELCCIVGFRPEDRIQPGRHQTNLLGTKVLFHQGIAIPAIETRKWLNL